MQPNLAVYRQVFSLVRPYPTLLMALVVATLLSTLAEGLGLSLILPLLDTNVITNNFLQDIPLLGAVSQWTAQLTLAERVRWTAVALVIMMLLRSFFALTTHLLAMRLQLTVERDLERAVLQQLHDLQLGFINGLKMGDLVTFLSHHVRQCGRLLQSFNNGLANGFTLLIYVVLALLISWPLTLLALGLVLILAVVAKRGFATRIKAAGKAEIRAMRELRTLTVESLTGLKLIHLFGCEPWNLARLEAKLANYQQAAYASQRQLHLSRHSVLLLAVFLLSGLLISSTFLLGDGLGAWLGRITLLLVIAFRLIGPIAALSLLNSQIINLTPTLQGVFDFLNRADKPYLHNGTQHFTSLQQGIRLENITFCYAPAEAEVLKNVSFVIPKGQLTAVVGPSGAGKSSLVNLLARLYDPTLGQLYIDGVDLRLLDITSWRTQIAVVSQDIFIFHDTVRANLQFARQNATEAEIIAAAQLAQAHNFIMALPDQYDTILGDRGVRLSGGQQQRIAIARAILADPQLLIFDEATSALDSETEQALQQAIEQYGHTRTLLVIAHRLSTIRKADNIVVLDGGRVVEQGSHAKLLATAGHYRRLVEAQNCP